MSACGHCGLALEDGAAACGQCGFAVASQRSATAGGKWGTLDIKRAPRAASVALPASAARPEPSPLTAAEPVSANEEQESAGSGPSLELDARAARPRAGSQPLRVPQAAEPRTGTRPIGGGREPQSRVASRPLTRPLGAEAGPAARSGARPPSGSVAVQTGQQPAGAAGRVKPGRAQSRSLSGTLPIPQLSAAGGAAPAEHTETGMLDIDGRFSDAMQDAPALELASVQPQPLVPKLEESPAHKPRAQAEPEREDPAEQRPRRVRELARYAPPPPKLFGAIPYFLRVYSRRRELQAQVLNLTQQRKRLDLAAEDALCLLAQALSAKRNDVRLRELAAQLRVVSETAQDMGTKAAAAKRTENVHKQELQALERDIAEAQAKAAPVQAREQQLMQAIADHKAQSKRREMLVRKADAELKQLKLSADAASLAKIAAVDAEREDHYGEMQSLNVQLIPLEEDLSVLRGTLAVHLNKLEELEQRKQRMLGAIDRDQGRERIASGGTHSAYREALRSLANAALRAGLAELAPEAQQAAEEARNRAAVHRESEELMRSAVSCYDPIAYARGMQLLVGSVVGTFLLFAALIAF
jgi:hypothetical protein